MSTRGGLADAKKKCAVTTNGKKSAEAIVPEKNPERAEQSLVLSRFRKEVNMKNAEYQGSLSCHKEIVRNTKGMRERRVLAVRKERNRAVQTCLKGF